MLQIGRDGAKCRGQFTAIIAIALACIRADPLARMHLKRRGARADHLTTLASSVARRTDGIKSASCCRQGRIAGQRALPCCLTRRIDVKDHVAATLPIEDAANRFRGPAFGKGMLLEERAERFQTRAIDIGQEATQTGAVRKTSASKERHEG